MNKSKKENNADNNEKRQTFKTEEGKGISRRGFLKTAAAGAAIAGSAGLIAGVPKAFAETKLKESTGDPAGAKPIPPVAPPAKWDKEADVVIIGSGGGGLTGAVKSAEKGKSVIVIEKLQGPGGNSKEAGLFFTGGGSKLQNAVKFALPSFPYNPDALVEMVSPWYQHTADKSLLRALAVKGPECVDWMGDCGVPWELNLENDKYFGPGVHIWKGSCKDGNYTRAMKPVCDHMYELARKKGTEFIFQTSVVRLVEKNGRIVGVKTKNMKGQTLFIRAKQGVILAAGGFAVNRDMLEKYTPYANSRCGASFAMPSDTGEVIRMGIGAGADLAGLGSTSCFDGGIDWVHENRGTFHQYLYNGSTQLARQPWLSVDITGERYQYLNSDPAPNLWNLSAIQMSRPGGRGFVIFDDDYEKNIWKFEQTYCRKPLTPTMANADRVPAWLAPTDWRDGVKAALKAGVIKKADTIDDLGKLLGFDAGVLSQSVVKWNEVCRTGKDNPVYQYKPSWLIPIKKPPYYGIRLGGFLYATACGLRVTPGMQVVNNRGKAIPGLYATFHVAGGQVGEQAVTGICFLADVGLSMTGGYIAAETIIKDNA